MGWHNMFFTPLLRFYQKSEMGKNKVGFHDFNINDFNVSFDILAVTESHIKKDSSSPVNLHLDNYSIEQTPNENSWWNLTVNK